MPIDLIGAIKEKQQRIIDLKREIRALEAELRQAKEVLRGRPKRETGNVAIRKRPIRQQSSVWWAKSMLQHAGKPLHIDELLNRIAEMSGQNHRKSTLVSSLSRYVRARDTFTRPEVGVYGLLEFAEEKIDVQKEGSSPI